MAAIRLLATDLDGTLIGTGREFPLFVPFRERIDAIRRRNGCVWAICTGRTGRSFRRFFAPMRMVGLQPDYVIVRHAYIGGPRARGFISHFFWNVGIAYEQWAQRLRVRRTLDRWHRAILRGIQGVETLMRGSDRLWVSFVSEDGAAQAEQLLKAQPVSSRYLRVFRRRKEVDVRSVPFTKGLALSELAGHLGIRREEILAIGNGHNDASMLDGTVAQHTGCPVNSEPEIVQAVHEAGGHIASQPGLGGVIEILDAVETGQVRSALPDWWRSPETVEGDEARDWKRSHRQRRRVVPNILLAGAAVYVVLLVFAQFDLLPFARAIRMPFELLMAAIRRVAGV